MLDCIYNLIIRFTSAEKVSYKCTNAHHIFQILDVGGRGIGGWRKGRREGEREGGERGRETEREREKVGGGVE